MAIPLTCPGCQAAFEVPDTLGGKTIRCTSCKTQLTVPAAGAADAKKPFGWASSPSKPVAALSLDDDRPTAKATGNGTTKAALTRPAAKVAVAVVEDDDEDDRKSSPNKSAAKSGSKITGAPKKRRDDDDDDDDDDQPRRKKKKNTSGGSGAMIALIGGGVVCLAAVVGLSVWLLSGDKKEAAKSDSNSTTSTPPAGGRPDGGGRPAPGNGDGNADGGLPDGGMTPNKPGRPGGGRPDAAVPGPEGGGAATGGSAPGVAGVAGVGGGAPGVGAGTDTEINDPPPTSGGGGFPPGGPPAGVGFPGGPPGAPGRPPGFPGGGQPPGIGGIQPPGIGGVQPPGIGGVQPPGIGGIPGRPPGGGQPGRPPGGPGAAGGDGPPGIGGGFGQPADSNPAPFGSVTNGKKKATIPQFFTGAFDSDKKEFFTFSTAPEKGKSVTKLNRYDVSKGFDGMGSYKVPRFVTRAVIDPSKGLLYAATTTPNASVGGNHQYEQTAGVGDVEVFDLNAIRDGKGAAGADLKPLGTFSIGLGKKIHGLELTPDGKTLIVLTTTTSTNPKNTPKSVLTRYDTETRKPTAEKPKDLPEPAWDMSKSSDGKYLVVVDLAVGQGKVAHVRTFDLNSETLTAVKALPLQGTANDVAASTTGQFAGVVLGAAGTKVLLATEAETKDFDFGFGWKAAAKPGYVEFSPDGKLLFVSGHVGLTGRQSAGLDVYEVTDANSPTGLKKKASILTAGEQAVGGHFFVSPDGEYLVFHTGVVVAANDIGGSNGEAVAAAGGGGVGGAPAAGFPGGVQPAPGAPPGGLAPIAPGVVGGVPPGGAPGGPPGGYGSIPPRPPPGGAPGGPPGGYGSIPPRPPPGGAPAGAPGAPPGGLTPSTPGVGGGAPATPPGGAAPPGAPGGQPIKPNLPMAPPVGGGIPGKPNSPQ